MYEEPTEALTANSTVRGSSRRKTLYAGTISSRSAISVARATTYSVTSSNPS